MKVYLIYLKDTNINIKIYPGVDKDEIYESDDEFYRALYAVTDSKKYYKIFINTHNMKLFDTVIIHVTEEKYYELLSEEKNHFVNHLLDLRNFYTRGEKNGKIIKEEIKVLTTQNEYQYIKLTQDDIISELLIPIDAVLYGTVRSDYFKEKYKSVLNEYFYYDRYMTDDHPSEVPPWEIGIYDTLAFYCLSFGNIYKKGINVKKCEYGNSIKSRKQLPMTLQNQ